MEKISFWNKVGLWIVGLLTFIFIAYVVVQYFIFGPSKEVGFVSTKEGIHYHPWITILYIHIIFGTLALLLGPLQFNKTLRRKKKNLHRNIGKIYLGSIIISFIFGLYIAYYGTGGLTGVIGFYSLEFAWIFTTLFGFFKIRKKEIKSHQEWMLRSYAVTLTFVTFRIGAIFTGFLEDKPGVFFGLTIIFSWMINLLIAERIISKAKKQKVNPPNPSQVLS